MSLLALAAATRATALAARLAALALAAVFAVVRLGCGSLCDCGYGKNGCERDQCKCTFHLFLLLDAVRHVAMRVRARPHVEAASVAHERQGVI